MPFSAPHLCGRPGCGATVPMGKANCPAHTREERPTAHQRGYSSRWQRASRVFLRKNPLCAECARQGRVTEARVTDHVIPHRGNDVLFWDESNWQPLCDYTTPWNCHGKKTGEGR